MADVVRGIDLTKPLQPVEAPVKVKDEIGIPRKKTGLDRFMEAAMKMSESMGELFEANQAKSKLEIGMVTAFNDIQKMIMGQFPRPTDTRPEDNARRVMLQNRISEMEASKQLANDVVRGSSTSNNALHSSFLSLIKDLQEAINTGRDVARGIFRQ